MILSQELKFIVYFYHLCFFISFLLCLTFGNNKIYFIRHNITNGIER